MMGNVNKEFPAGENLHNPYFVKYPEEKYCGYMTEDIENQEDK